MGFLLIIGLIILIAIVAPKSNDVVEAVDKLVIQKKACPPHQWFWQEIVDQAGVRQGERIVCKACGPLASQSGREE